MSVSSFRNSYTPAMPAASASTNIDSSKEKIVQSFPILFKKWALPNFSPSHHIFVYLEMQEEARQDPCFGGFPVEELWT